MPKPVSPSEMRPTAVPNAAEAPFPRIPGYRFQKKLGQGGMATVYLATQESLDRPVSIKVMEREALSDEVSMQRFENEARTIAKLTHPSIVNIYEVGRTADARMYYIMPYLANGDLSQRDLRNDEKRIVEVLRSLLSALDYAHARGVVHRDVKEENVLFDVADRPLLTDFGIALSKRDKSRITTAGLAVGSSGYMAPEQARGDEVDGRADLYSVGVLAFELLTGRLPFRSADALALALLHAQQPVPRLPPSKRHWQSFIDRAMAKLPDHRFRDAQQMAQALDKVGRRTGNHMVVRMLRRLDSTVAGQFWKRPVTLALGGALLVAIGIYSARDQLPAFGKPVGSTPAQPKALPPSDPVAAPIASLSLPAPLPSASERALPDPSRAAATPSVRAQAVPAPSMATPAAPAGSAAHEAASAATAVPTGPASIIRPAGVPTPALVASNAPVSTAGFAVAKPGAANASISPDAAVTGAARDALAHGNLTAPADANAVDLTRMAWRLSPATPDTKALAGDVLKAMSAQQANAIAQHHDQRVLDLQLKAQQLADATVGRSGPAWRALHVATGNAIGQRVQLESAASDSVALKRSDALARQLELTDAYAHGIAAAQRDASATAAAATAAAASVGPGFVVLPVAPRAKEAVALARTEVTRHEYAQFVNATRHPASTCTDPKTPDQSGTRRNWTEPGFNQGSDQPVVCVSWNDANAYVQWLSAHTGQHYRLASTTDWHAPARKGAVPPPAAVGDLGGEYSEWLQNCASGCQGHLVAPRAWRARGAEAPSGRMAAQGFPDVGFRVVRVLDAQH